MVKSAPSVAVGSEMQESMASGIDYAVRVVNDVASTIQAVLDVTGRVDDKKNGEMMREIMASSLQFTSASVADFLSLSKTLLRVQSAQDYFEVQRDFFQARAGATRDHIQKLGAMMLPPQ